LRTKFSDLRAELDPYLATEYDIHEEKYKDNYKDEYLKWKRNYKPFHLWMECYKIMRNGGFDVIIRNPPYVEWSNIKGYNLLPDTYNTRNCGNLYTVICERSYTILRPTGHFGMIMPISCISTDRMQSLRVLWHKKNFESHISHYSGDSNPSVLFQGVKFRLSIVLQHATSSPLVFSTHFQKWLPQERNYLFPLLKYVKVEPIFMRLGLIPKIASEQHANILRKLCSERSILQANIARTSEYQVYCHRIIAHFIKAIDFIPFFQNERDGQKRSEDYKVYPSTSQGTRDTIAARLNSSLFYSWLVTFSVVYLCGK